MYRSRLGETTACGCLGLLRGKVLFPDPSFLDIESVLAKITQQRTNFAEVAYLDLELTTKIVKELESQR